MQTTRRAGNQSLFGRAHDSGRACWAWPRAVVAADWLVNVEAEVLARTRSSPEWAPSRAPDACRRCSNGTREPEPAACHCIRSPPLWQQQIPIGNAKSNLRVEATDQKEYATDGSPIDS